MIDEKWLFDYIDALPEDSPSRIALVNMYVAWRKEQELRTNELDIQGDWGKANGSSGTD